MLIQALEEQIHWLVVADTSVGGTDTLVGGTRTSVGGTEAEGGFVNCFMLIPRRIYACEACDD